jgi:hypothetical protein
MRLRRLAAAGLLALALAVRAAAQQSSGPNISVWTNRFTQVPMSTVTRPANTTAYAASEIVCASTCAPMTINVAAAPAGEMALTRVSMLKSGTGTVNATFTLWLYAQSPMLSGLSDQSAYSGPYVSDLPYYLGSAVCAAPNATSDATPERWYECTLNNPNFTGVYNLTAWANSRTIYGVLSANAAYTPASAETFTPYLSGQY